MKQCPLIEVLDFVRVLCEQHPIYTFTIRVKRSSEIFIFGFYQITPKGVANLEEQKCPSSKVWLFYCSERRGEHPFCIGKQLSYSFHSAKCCTSSCLSCAKECWASVVVSCVAKIYLICHLNVSFTERSLTNRAFCFWQLRHWLALAGK